MQFRGYHFRNKQVGPIKIFFHIRKEPHTVAEFPHKLPICDVNNFEVTFAEVMTLETYICSILEALNFIFSKLQGKDTAVYKWCIWRLFASFCDVTDVTVTR